MCRVPCQNWTFLFIVYSLHRICFCLFLGFGISLRWVSIDGTQEIAEVQHIVKRSVFLTTPSSRVIIGLRAVCAPPVEARRSHRLSTSSNFNTVKPHNGHVYRGGYPNYFKTTCLTKNNPPKNNFFLKLHSNSLFPLIYVSYFQPFDKSNAICGRNTFREITICMLRDYKGLTYIWMSKKRN